MVAYPAKGSSQSTSFVLLLFSAAAGVPVFVHYVAASLLGMGLAYDAGQVWLPIARQLSEGEVLYVTTRPDNKTPLFHALNYAVYRTGYYTLVFFLLVGLANTVTAYLLWSWLGREDMHRAGVLAGFLFVAAIPLINGDIINVRSFALVFLLLAVLERTPVKRGIWTALGVLFSQFVVFVIPVLLYDGLRGADDWGRWTALFIASGLGVGVLCFSALLAVWGPTAFVRGIDMTFLSIAEYAVSHQDDYNPFLHPFLWLKNLVLVATNLLFVLVPAGGAILQALLVDRDYGWNPFGMGMLLSGSFLLTLFIKSLPYYWMFPTAFLTVIAAVGVVRWIDRYASEVDPRNDMTSNAE